MLPAVKKYWKKYISSRIQAVSLTRHISFADYKKYLGAKTNQLVSLKVGGITVAVRKGTPDIRVAISCLKKNEFSKLGEYLHSGYSGNIIDAGGYIGTAAIALSLLFPRAKVISIEPSLENLEVLKKNVSPFKNISVIHGALVARKASTVVLRDRGTGQYGYTAVALPSDNRSAICIEHCPAVTFESLGFNASEIGILKLDIEGGELELFSKNLDFLKEITIVAAELHDRIAPGCTAAFLNFSRQRTIFHAGNEQYFSVKN